MGWRGLGWIWQREGAHQTSLRLSIPEVPKVIIEVSQKKVIID
jgi:hypothetical protein